MSGGFLQSDDNAINIDNIDIDIDLDNLIASIVSGNNILTEIQTKTSTSELQASGNQILIQVENILTDVKNTSSSGNNILTEINTNQDLTNSKLDLVNTNLGTEGVTPPVIVGTGIIGWLRAIYEKLFNKVNVEVTNFPTSTPGLTNAELRATPVPVSVSGLNITIPSGTTFNIDLSETNKIIATGNDVVTSIDTSLGHQSDSMAANNIGSFSLIALFKRLLDKLDTIKDSLSVFGGTLDSPFTLDYFFQTSATSALQVSGNNILTSIDTKLDNQATSAFGDINTAELIPLIQLDFIYGLNIQTGKSTIANTGVVDTLNSRLRIQTGTNATGSAIFESVRPAKYRPGQGVDAKFTFAFTTGVVNSQQEIGIGNLIDGYFFGYVGTSFGIIYRNNSVDTFIPQSSWNIDPCDGTGVTGVNINPTFGNIGRVKYPYLGYGNIKFFIQNPNDGTFILIHIIKYVNTTQTVQLTNPNLSFWARVVNTGNTSNLIAYCGSVGIFLSGERKFLGATWAINNFKTGITTQTNILTIKNATSYNGVTNRSLIRLKSISFASDGGNGVATLIVTRNATLGGTPVYTAINGTIAGAGATITNGNSITSYDTAGTTVTGGQALFNTIVSRNSSSFLDVTELDLFLDPGSTLTFSVVAQTSSTVSVAINWVEDV